MRYFLILSLLFASAGLFAGQINNTGICSDTVQISSKTVFIKNPFEIIYKEVKERLPFFDNTPRIMKTSGYWISKLDNPDKIILSKKEIKEFNERIFKTKVNINNLKDYPETIKTADFLKTLNTRFLMITDKQYFNAKFEELPLSYFQNICDKIDVSESSETLHVKFAVTVRYSDIRIMPSEDKIFSSKSSFDIDRLQEESLDFGTPLAVICQTKDKQWSYVAAPVEEGWIKTANIAFTDRKTLSKWINAKKTAVIINTKADVYLDESMKNYFEYVRMGSRFPLLKKIGKTKICVSIPASDAQGNLYLKQGYISSDNINKGFLEYSQRNILIQAFKHLNSPYSWGGYNGEQDCSSFIGQIFNCFGIVLPETSFQKIKCGTLTADFSDDISSDEKNKIIFENAAAGLSLVYLPGHIMLYIGNNDNKPYAIHAINGLSAYNQDNEKTMTDINKIIISDLDIGNNVSGNSLIDRTVKVNLLK